ncbi:MAG: ABC transporter permease [Actinomycetota bacterium]
MEENLWRQLVDWFGDPAHWIGPEGVPTRVLEHVQISATALLICLLIALPVGLYVGHARRMEFLAVSVANLGRAIPSLAILAIVFQVTLKLRPESAFGFLPTVIAMVFLGIPPILTNAYVGIQSVDQDTLEAARGMGLRPRQVLARLEIPLAMPLIVGGIRTAAVQIVATATLAAVISGGGLGRFIVDGFAGYDEGEMLAGVLLVAGLAILTEAVFAGIERLATPRTQSRGRRRARTIRPDVEPIARPVS